MTIRRLLWIAIPLLLLVVLAGAGGVTWYLLRGTVAPIRLVAIGTDGRIKHMSGPGPGRFRPAELKAWLVENAK